MKMGIGDVFKGLLGGAPKTSGAASKEVGDAAKKSARQRSALFMTEGGAVGEELSPEQIKKRDTLFGN